MSELLAMLSTQAHERKRYRFLWRGVSDMRYRFDPGIVRRIAREKYQSKAQSVTEEDVSQAEASLLGEARALGLHQRVGLEPLTDDELRALLQHHGAATRLIDVSTNAFISLWMAVENERQTDVSGALFAIDWPAQNPDRPSTVEERVREEGTTWLWETPRNLDPRIQSQSGKFLVGRVPRAEADRALTSLPLIFGNARGERIFTGKGSGRFPKSPTVIFEITPQVKAEARSFLREVVGMTPAGVYPDLAGFAQANKA